MLRGAQEVKNNNNVAAPVLTELPEQIPLHANVQFSLENWNLFEIFETFFPHNEI